MRLRLLIPLLAWSLYGCSPTPAPSEAESARVSLGTRMAAPPDPGFARAWQPRDFSFPADHGAHPAFATEWWYFTGNLASGDGHRFGYQLTLFRVGLAPGEAVEDSDWRTNQLYMGHLAISDIAARRHHARERFSRAAAGLAGAETAPLRVWLGPWSIRGAPTTLFPLTLSAADPQLGLQLTLEAGDRPMVLQGERGLSRKSAQPGNASYYYSFTRLPTRGELRVGGETFAVGGDSWFDREWSSSALSPDQAGWDWFALQLDDGRDLMFYRLRDHAGNADPFSRGVLVGTDGLVEHLAAEDVTLTPRRLWTSPEGTAYPVEWTLTIPSRAMKLEVRAAFDAQEMPTTVRYWEGAVEVDGSHRGRGYLELSGYADRLEDVDPDH
jgi:predicted secreted hydrolase